MKRAIVAALISLAATSAAVAVPAGPAAAACLTTDPSRVTGGYLVSIICGGPIGIVNGYGSTPSDANLEALLLIKMYTDGGPLCSGMDVDKDGAVYWVTLNCGALGLGLVNGQGDTLTRAAQIARLTAEVLGSGRRAATGDD
jgi:hypothetical protein